MPDRPSTSPRLLVARFAAHLAHLLNGERDIVVLNPFALHQTVIGTLGSAAYSALVGARLAGPERNHEEIAWKYLDTVLDRRLSLARANHMHKGHELFLALCRRGTAAQWTRAELLRGANPAADGGSDPPSDFGSVAARLEQVDRAIGPGNPAHHTREQFGPLNLIVAGGFAEVAEELSVWKSVACAPPKLRTLKKCAEFDAFCSLVIKAVEAANAPFGAFLTVGLSPYEWRDELSHNTVKALGRFLGRVRGLLGEKAGGRGDLETWGRAWQDCPVPGFASADALWNSALGRALRLPVAPLLIPWDEIDESIVQDGEMQKDAGFDEQLAATRAAGIIDDYEMWVYRKIRAGASIADLEDVPETLARFGSEPIDLAAYVEELTERVLAWARGHLHGGRLHPDSDDTADDPE